MRTVLVQEVYDPEVELAAIISEDALLEDAIIALVKNSHVRGIFLIDSKQRFAGIITRHDLLKWARLRLGGKGESQDISIRDIFRMISSSKAKDLAHGDWHTLGVKPTDDLATAMDQMIEYDLIDLPVVDDDGRIIGDLKISHVLSKALEAGKDTS